MSLCKRTNTKCESPLAFVCSIFCAFSCKFSFEIQLWPVTTTSLCSSFHIFSRKTKLVSFATASAIARRLRDFSRSWRISCLEMLDKVWPFFLVTFADPRVPMPYSRIDFHWFHPIRLVNMASLPPCSLLQCLKAEVLNLMWSTL